MALNTNNFAINLIYMATVVSGYYQYDSEQSENNKVIVSRCEYILNRNSVDITWRYKHSTNFRKLCDFVIKEFKKITEYRIAKHKQELAILEYELETVNKLIP